ncbi:MAG: LacI family transcriptional regulator [Victivallaceae bacterium]|nr:LacI family transcriptional regulator [Victivallaceae bacterium]
MIVLTNNQVPLYIQIKDHIIDQIRNGNLPPNSRLPGERDLAAKYKISRGTAKQALQELESKQYIERIPSRGSFVKSSGKTVNLVLVFPEKSMSRDQLSADQWSAMSEMHRGLLEGGNRYKTKITFQYFPDSDDAKTVCQQGKELADFDGAIFPGPQSAALKEELANYGTPYLSLISDIEVPGALLHYNRGEVIADAVRFIAKVGYRSVGMIVSEQESVSKDEKIKLCTKEFSRWGIEFSDRWILKAGNSEVGAYEMLKKQLPQEQDECPELFFCTAPVYAFALLRIINERGWNIPEDISIMGYANDMHIRHTTPELTYVYVPYYEVGIEACRLLSEEINGINSLPISSTVSAELRIGATTFNKSNCTV